MGSHFHDRSIDVGKAEHGLVFISGLPKKDISLQTAKVHSGLLLRILSEGNCKICYCFFPSEEEVFSISLPGPVWC